MAKIKATNRLSFFVAIKVQKEIIYLTTMNT